MGVQSGEISNSLVNYLDKDTKGKSNFLFVEYIYYALNAPK